MQKFTNVLKSSVSGCETNPSEYYLITAETTMSKSIKGSYNMKLLNVDSLSVSYSHIPTVKDISFLSARVRLLVW